MTDDMEVGKGAEPKDVGPDQAAAGEEQQSASEIQPNTGAEDQAAGESPSPVAADGSSEDAGLSSQTIATDSNPEGAPDAEGASVGVVNPEDASEEDAEAAMMQMLDDLPQEGQGSAAEDIEFTSASASKAEFQQLQQPAGAPTPQNIELLMDVDLPVSIELGRTKMSVANILALGPGSVVELNKLAGEPVDLLVNYKVVARGEVVVVDENFGLRVTQLMTPEERLKALAED